MRFDGRVQAFVIVALAVMQSGCGLSVSQLPEVWDRVDPDATVHLEKQIKLAIFCQLRYAALDARTKDFNKYLYDGTNVTSPEDIPFADSWGAQVTLTLTVDEKTALTPNVTFKNALLPDKGVAQNFNLGVAGALSSQNVRYDKFNFFYTAYDLIHGAGEGDACHDEGRPKNLLGKPSSSSPFVDGSQLGIREWLPGAVSVSDFERSSRASASGEGLALGSSGSFVSDSATYDNKFVIVSDGNVTPTWSLVKIATGTTPLLDLNRTRTHELLITIAPGAIKIVKNKATKRVSVLTVGPSISALNSHFASEIGSAVSAAIQH
jgi:hypothetical protein